MRNIILLDDRPYKLSGLISQIKNDLAQKINEITVLYYDNGFEKVNMEDLREHLCVNAIRVDIWNFDDKMDELYQEPENLFIFDTDISSKAEEIFNSVIMLVINYLKRMMKGFGFIRWQALILKIKF